MRVNGQGRWMAAGAVLGLLAATGSAGCSATPAPATAPSGSPVATSAPAPTAVQGSPAAPSPSPSPSPTGIQNLLVTPAIRSQLTAAYVAMRQIQLSDVAGTRPGSVYYAYDPATRTYWAMADFDPSKSASLNVQVGFQDGGATGLFTKIGDGAWSGHGGGVPPVCAEVRFFPPSVMKAWSLPTSIPGISC